MKFIEKILMPHLEWVQLEVSSLCNASCFYCPHTTHRKQWTGRNITLNEFLKIMPYLKKLNFYIFRDGESLSVIRIFLNLLRLQKIWMQNRNNNKWNAY